MKDTDLNVMVVGGGAREHATGWKLKQSSRVSTICFAPGNAGTAALGENLAISATDVPTLVKAAQEKKIDLVVVGPEAPLAAGIVDVCQDVGIAVFGPTKAATQIESSKVFAKRLMEKWSIPTASFEVFNNPEKAKQYVGPKQFGSNLPAVIKADGLTAGKGSFVVTSQDQALEAISDIMEKRIFGEAGNRVVIEEFLRGREASLLAFTDGYTVRLMISACDYKRQLDGDQGPNTGGMGSYSPSEFMDKELIEKVKEGILERTVMAIGDQGKPYRGVLYAGLMITPEEGPKVLEFNARFGDPENQVQLPLLKTDLVEIMLAVVNGTLDQVKIEWSDEACVGVVMASAGYPGNYQKGFPITGLDKVDEGILIFHAGTKEKEDQIVTDGGRVLTVVATGKTINEARKKVYSNLPRIRFEGCQYRGDIAKVAEQLKMGL